MARKPGRNGLAVRNPYSGSIIKTISTQNRGHVEKALATATALYADRDAWLPLPRRIEILERAVAIMQSDLESLAMGIAREGGKPLMDAHTAARGSVVPPFSLNLRI